MGRKTPMEVFAPLMTDRPEPAPKTFDELFAEHNLTAEEREALVIHLAALRMAKTLKLLRSDYTVSRSKT